MSGSTNAALTPESLVEAITPEFRELLRLIKLIGPKVVFDLAIPITETDSSEVRASLAGVVLRASWTEVPTIHRVGAEAVMEVYYWILVEPYGPINGDYLRVNQLRIGDAMRALLPECATFNAFELTGISFSMPA